MNGSDRLERFEALVLPHLQACHNLARWLLRSAPDAEDCVQEAMVRALRGFGDFRGGDGRAWLLAIVRNSCYTLLRRRPAAPLPESWDGPGPEPDPEQRLIQKTDGERVRQALQELPLEFREVLILKEFEGLSYREIAAIVEIPLGTVMSRLSRARKRLQEGLLAPGGRA